VPLRRLVVAVIPLAILIRVEFERVEPILAADYLNDGDQARMAAWLERRPELAQPIARPFELADRQRAA
jgi:hypothetical protein